MFKSKRVIHGRIVIKWNIELTGKVPAQNGGGYLVEGTVRIPYSLPHYDITFCESDWNKDWGVPNGKSGRIKTISWVGPDPVQMAKDMEVYILKEIDKVKKYPYKLHLIDDYGCTINWEGDCLKLSIPTSLIPLITFTAYLGGVPLGENWGEKFGSLIVKKLSPKHTPMGVHLEVQYIRRKLNELKKKN